MQTVLIVEDNELSMMLFSDLLLSKGYRVRKAADAETALQILDEDVPDLVLMDIQLPNLSGLELSQMIRSDARTTDVPIIAVSACAMRRDRERYGRYCNDYLAKPVRVGKLLSAIHRQLPPEVKAAATANRADASVALSRQNG